MKFTWHPRLGPVRGLDRAGDSSLCATFNDSNHKRVKGVSQTMIDEIRVDAHNQIEPTFAYRRFALSTVTWTGCDNSRTSVSVDLYSNGGASRARPGAQLRFPEQAGAWIVPASRALGTSSERERQPSE